VWRDQAGTGALEDDTNYACEPAGEASARPQPRPILKRTEPVRRLAALPMLSGAQGFKDKARLVFSPFLAKRRPALSNLTNSHSDAAENAPAKPPTRIAPARSTLSGPPLRIAAPAGAVQRLGGAQRVSAPSPAPLFSP
jgi:hypothetical protein